MRTHVHAGGGIYLLSHPEAAYAAEGPDATESATEAAAIDAPPLASALAGGSSIVSADVALSPVDGDATLDALVVGSFTVDGLTYAVNDGEATLVAVDFAVASDGLVTVPESVAYEGAGYPVVAIGPYAFYLSGATDVALPVSIASVDDRAFRSSDVAWVDVAEGNPAYASYDGALYSADLTRLLLIPGGRQGAVRIDSHAEEVPSAAFSHCAEVTAISVDADGAAYSSWNDCLYDADGTTLVRVPAGAIDITIRDGCTAIAAGSMEGCAKLERINAPASVASISSDVFEDVPTVSLPAVSLAGDPSEPEGEIPQLTAMVALSSSDDDLPEADPVAIEVSLAKGADAAPWRQAAFTVDDEALDAQSDSAGGSSQDASASDDPEAVAPVAAMQSASTNRAPVSGKVHLYSAENPSSIVNFMWLKQNADGTLQYGGGNNLGDGYDYAAATSFGFNASGFYVNYKSGLHIYYLADVPDMSSWGGGEAYVAAHQSLSDYTLYDIAYYYRGDAPSVKYDRHSTTSYESIATAVKGYDFYLTPGKAKMVTWNGNQSGVDSSKTSTSSVSYVGSGRKCSAPTISSSDYPAGYGSYSWYSTSATSGDSYICSASGTSPAITSDRTYYARWSKKASYKVTLDGNEATTDGTTAVYYWPDKGYTTSSSSTTTVDVGKKLLATLPTRDGYDFKGYYSSKTSSTRYVDADGNLTSSAKALDAAATWYARWTKKTSYKVTLDGNEATTDGTTAVYYWPDKGYTTSSSSTTTVDVGKKLLATLPTRDDYGFEGYYSSTSSDAVQCIDSEGNLTKDAPSLKEAATWYARWKRTYVTITWDPNGEGATVSTTSSKLECGTAGLPLPLPVRPGYAYAYWHTDPVEYSPVWSNSVVPSTDTTYYAHWTKKDSYSVDLDCNGATGTGTTKIYYWPERGYTDSADSITVIESGSTAITSLPTFTGYTFKGYYSSASSPAIQYVDSSGKLTSNAPALSESTTWYAQWEKKASHTVTLNGNGATGSGTTAVYYWPDKGYTTSSSSTTVVKAGEKVLSALPVRSGYSFKGYYSSMLSSATRYIDAAGCLTTAAPALSTSTTWYAQWVELGSLTWYSAEDPTRTDAFSWLASSGSAATGSGGGNHLGASTNTLWPVERTSNGFMVSNRFYLTPGGYSEDRPNLSDYVLYDIAYYRKADGSVVEPAVGWKQEGTQGALEVYLTPGTPRKVFWDAGEGTVDQDMSWVGDGRGCASPVPARDGYICTGWWTAPDGGEKAATPGAATVPITQDTTLYARWTPRVAAVAPVSAEVRLDILGVEGQETVDGKEGYVESQCVAPIKVTNVAFVPLAGAAELFGSSNAASVSLDAFADAAEQPCFSFPLDAAATLEAADSDEAAQALAPFHMQARGDRVYVVYRFGMPDDLREAILGAIDPARFEGTTTPVCSITYTVGLA